MPPFCSAVVRALLMLEQNFQISLCAPNKVRIPAIQDAQDLISASEAELSSCPSTAGELLAGMPICTLNRLPQDKDNADRKLSRRWSIMRQITMLARTCLSHRSRGHVCPGVDVIQERTPFM